MYHFPLSGLVTLLLITAALVTSQTWRKPHASSHQSIVLASTQEDSAN